MSDISQGKTLQNLAKVKLILKVQNQFPNSVVKK